VTHCDHTSGCITCGDEAVELTILRMEQESGLALCSDDFGDTESVEIELVQPVREGDRVLVHAGTAIQVARKV
jgi:hydrogenase maturation factor